MISPLTEQQAVPRIGIVAQNHAGYVNAVLTCLETGRIAVPLRASDDQYRIQAAQVETILLPEPQSSWFSASFQPLLSSQIALIAFTSGTEGNPKGVLLSHTNLADVVTRLNQAMQVDGSIREYVGVPVYHSFGFGRCRAIAAIGGHCFIPANFNPAEIGTLLKQGEINAISAVPSLWRILLANQDLIGGYGKRVQWIEIGSQSMSRQEKEAMKRLFPNARILQHYGLTEASRSTLLEIHQEEGDALDSVGKALDGVEIKLTAEGLIAIRGNHVASAYLVDGQMMPLQDADGWFVTRDLGRLAQEHLFYQGRADDIINCGGIKVNPEALEARIYAELGYQEGFAICRRPDPLRGEGFLVAVTPQFRGDRPTLLQHISKTLHEFGVNAGNAIALIEVEHLPTTATGKVQRNQLATYNTDYPPQTETVSDELSETSRAALNSLFSRVLHIASIKPEDSFISLGGDSLSYVQLSIELERHLGYLPLGWENFSIRELEQLQPQQHSHSRIDTNVLVRALAIASIVISHANLLPLGGGALFLLMLAGVNFARFQSDSLFQGNFGKPLASLVKNLVGPYLAIALTYQLYQRELEPSILLFYSNFVSPHVDAIFPVWFVNVLVQIILIFSLPFALPPVRKFAARSPLFFGLLFLGLGAWTNRWIPHIWDAGHLYNRVPHISIWLFILGWCIPFARSTLQKVALTALLVILAPTSRGVLPIMTLPTILFGTLLIWVKNIPMPAAFKPPIQIISAAAYYIYLTHMIFMHILRHELGINNPWINTGIGIAGGVLIWMGIDKLSALLTKAQTQKFSPETSI